MPLKNQEHTPDRVFYTDQLKVPGTGVEPARPRARDPKSRVSTNSTIPALRDDLKESKDICKRFS